MSARDSERREGLRQPVCLPMKILFLSHPVAPGSPRSSSMKAAPVSSSDPTRGGPVSVPEETPHHALALDVSPRGFQLEVSGLAGRRFREDPEMLPRLEVHFAHRELHEHGAFVGRVRWARHEGRSGWRLGLLLDAPLTEEALREILWFGQPRPAKGRLARDVLCVVLAAAAASALWFSAYLAESSARKRAVLQQLTAEDEALGCKADRAAEQARQGESLIDPGASPDLRADPGRPASTADAASNSMDAAPARREDLLRGLVERAFRGGDAGLPDDE